MAIKRLNAGQKERPRPAFIRTDGWDDAIKYRKSVLDRFVHEKNSNGQPVHETSWLSKLFGYDDNCAHSCCNHDQTREPIGVIDMEAEKLSEEFSQVKPGGQWDRFLLNFNRTAEKKNLWALSSNENLMNQHRANIICHEGNRFILEIVQLNDSAFDDPSNINHMTEQVIIWLVTGEYYDLKLIKIFDRFVEFRHLPEKVLTWKKMMKYIANDEMDKSGGQSPLIDLKLGSKKEGHSLATKIKLGGVGDEPKSPIFTSHIITKDHVLIMDNSERDCKIIKFDMAKFNSLFWSGGARGRNLAQP